MNTLSDKAQAFVDACLNDNSIRELETALAGPVDRYDCAEWEITPAEWRAAIETALHELNQHEIFIQFVQEEQRLAKEGYTGPLMDL